MKVARPGVADLGEHGFRALRLAAAGERGGDSTGARPGPAAPAGDLLELMAGHLHKPACGLLVSDVIEGDARPGQSMDEGLAAERPGQRLCPSMLPRTDQGGWQPSRKTAVTVGEPVSLVSQQGKSGQVRIPPRRVDADCGIDFRDGVGIAAASPPASCRSARRLRPRQPAVGRRPP